MGARADDIAADHTVRPWLRWPDEGEKPHAAFLVYRDAGTDRTLRMVAERLSVSDTIVKRWSARFHWTARALSWDHAQRDAADAVARAATDRLTQQHLGASAQLLVAALELLRHGDDDQPPDAAKVAAASTAIDRAIKNQRLASGLPSDITKHDVTLRDTLQETLHVQRGLRAVIEEHICDDCRVRIGHELDRLAQHQRAIAARL